LPLPSGSRLGPFEILAPLGAGGMGEVYRARDPKLGREVAIKVLPESVARDPEALARFKVEARALAALSHPNILGIHDFDTDHDVSFAVMELLEGETLRDKLSDGAPLPLRKAIEYSREIALGLSAAHEKGIVHRDLKPENVFITKDDRVKLLDFGLAKRTEKTSHEDETSAPTQPKRTEAGIAMGTVGYMAPEQVRGLPVDHRADIFAFGAILYELLTGKRAFKGPTASDTLTAILRDEPPELSQTNVNIPAGLERIVRHCLEKSAAARAQSAHDLAFDLETLTSQSGAAGERSSPAVPSSGPFMRRGLVAALGTAAVVVVAVVAVIVMSRRPAAAPAHTGVKRLAVLPFENLGSKEDDYFADGITDEVRAKLTNLPGLEVIARTSSNGYRKTQKKLQEIGKELDVEYLLTGAVRFAKGGDGTRRVQVSPELSLASSAASRWAQPFDATLTDVFQVQGEIATRVAQALDVALSAGEKRRLEEKPTRNLPAYEAYLRGEEASQSMAASDPPSLRRAILHYEQAVALDAGFLEAWARLSRASSLLYANSTPTPAGARRALEAAEKALTIGPERPEGHQALGDYYRLVVTDSARALPELERARRLSPGSAGYATSLALNRQHLGQWEEALGDLEEAQRLDPRSVATLHGLGLAALRLHRTSEARKAFDRGLALAPTNLALLHRKAMTYLLEGDLAGARAALKAAPKEVEPTVLVAFVASAGDFVWVLDEAQRDLLVRLTPSAFDDDRGVWALCLTQAYALKRDEPSVRKYAEIARAAFDEQVTAAPQDAQLHAELGLSLAYLGRKAEAIREAEKAMELLPISRDAYLGPYLQHQLVRVYILTGENEKALDKLEPLLKIPYNLTPGRLRIDPNFDPLRQSPRFQKLVG
jgi:non-specific serine/threonine protein kinase